MLKKFIFSLTAAMALSLAAFAQDGKATLTGYIVDKTCSAKDAKAADPQAEAANESKGCILMESCLKSGLGIYVDGKYHEFDAKGTQLAKAALEKSKKAKGAKFKVTGTESGGRLAVESIEEVE
jgi:hypothetical protein